MQHLCGTIRHPVVRPGAELEVTDGSGEAGAVTGDAKAGDDVVGEVCCFEVGDGVVGEPWE